MDDHFYVCRLVRHLPVLRSLPTRRHHRLATMLRALLEGEDLRVRALALWEALRGELGELAREERELLGEEGAVELQIIWEEVQGAAAWVERSGALDEAARVAEEVSRAVGEAPLGPAILGAWACLRDMVAQVRAAKRAQGARLN